MDYATYKKIRAYCWQDLSPYIDTKFNNDTLDFQRDFDGRLADINHEYSAAMGLFQTPDLTAREIRAAQLLAAVSNHRRYAWWREPLTPDGTAPAEPLEPWQAAEVWAQTRAAVAEYAFFIPEREAVGLLALVAEERHTPTPAPVVAEGADFSLLATPEQLITAFGTFTKMDATWFASLKDTPALLAACKYKGTGGRGGEKPLFCPYEVMVWLIKPSRKKNGKAIRAETAWRMLKGNFPNVYNLHLKDEPNEDWTG